MHFAKLHAVYWTLQMVGDATRDSASELRAWQEVEHQISVVSVQHL